MVDFTNKFRVIFSPEMSEKLRKQYQILFNNIAKIQLSIAKSSLYSEYIVSPFLINSNTRRLISMFGVFAKN